MQIGKQRVSLNAGYLPFLPFLILYLVDEVAVNEDVHEAKAQQASERPAVEQVQENPELADLGFSSEADSLAAVLKHARNLA